VILDVFSRYAVGWMVATGESAALAEKLIADTWLGAQAGQGVSCPPTSTTTCCPAAPSWAISSAGPP